MKNHDLNARQWYLAVKALTQDLIPKEQKEWESLLANDEKLKENYRQVQTLWKRADKVPYGEIDIDADWKKVLGRIKNRRNYQLWFRYAAVISLVVAATFLIFKYKNIIFSSDQVKTITTIQAPAGSKTYIILPDSSKVWLNAAAKIILDREFGHNNRKIRLEGEAFFDVKKSKVPFQVFTSQYSIAVLGTAFNVRVYADDNSQVTTLIRGSLRVNNIHTSEGVRTALLKPGDRLTLWKDNRTAKLERGIDISGETAWKDGWLAVNSEPLDRFAKKLERLYDINIQFEDEELKSYRYTGKIKQLSLEQVLKALALTSPIAFQINEKIVTLGVNEDTESKYRTLQNNKN